MSPNLEESNPSAENASPTEPACGPVFLWEMGAAFFVFIFSMALVGLWCWTMIEFLRHFLEGMTQSSGLAGF